MDIFKNYLSYEYEITDLQFNVHHIIRNLLNSYIV
jgi:hypothetical protein